MLTNKEGEQVVDAQLDAQKELRGQKVVYIVDTELHSLMNQIIGLLENIETHLSSGSGEELNKEETD